MKQELLTLWKEYVNYQYGEHRYDINYNFTFEGFMEWLADKEGKHE